jgi:aspartokinase-like uncharacterized kinase
MTPRVVKLGGSLLDLADLADRIQRWLATQPTRSNVFVVGGGALAEAVRAADRVHKLDEVVAHWLCIRAMSITAELAATLLDWPIVYDLSTLKHEAPPCCVFDVYPFLKDVEPTLPGKRLPHGWHVTSDSIAARVAEVLSADELVLLKSTLPLGPLDLATAAAQNLVDPWFPQAARSLVRIRVVNLRAAGFPETALIPTPPRAL